jgi:predicted AAA+ superfamily ATPase
VQELTIFERDLKIDPTKEFITSIYGPRRSGKSFLFYSLLKKTNAGKVMYLNFDDIQLRELTPEDIMESVSLFHELYNEGPEILMLDEIQNINGWEGAVTTLYEKKKYRILLTGSSSKLLAKEISTTLRGRSLGYQLFPLSFREYLKFIGMDTSPPNTTHGIVDIRSLLDRYLSDGSFPGLIFEKGLLGRFYDDYVDLVIYRDLVERYGISNLGLLKFIIKNIIQSFSKELSINSLYNHWRSMRYEASKKTFYQYFTYLEDAIFVFPLRKYSRSQRTSDLSIPKVYLPDTGLPSQLFGYQKGRSMENCVFLELLRRSSSEPGMELYFWREKRSEIDFMIFHRDELSELIQVTIFLNEDNYKREVGTLNSVGDDMSCKNRTVITWKGDENAGEGVKVVPLWKFLMS